MYTCCNIVQIASNKNSIDVEFTKILLYTRRVFIRLYTYVRRENVIVVSKWRIKDILGASTTSKTRENKTVSK